MADRDNPWPSTPDPYDDFSDWWNHPEGVGRVMQAVASRATNSPAPASVYLDAGLGSKMVALNRGDDWWLELVPNQESDSQRGDSSELKPSRRPPERRDGSGAGREAGQRLVACVEATFQDDNGRGAGPYLERIVDETGQAEREALRDRSEAAAGIVRLLSAWLFEAHRSTGEVHRTSIGPPPREYGAAFKACLQAVDKENRSEVEARAEDLTKLPQHPLLAESVKRRLLSLDQRVREARRDADYAVGVASAIEALHFGAPERALFQVDVQPLDVPEAQPIAERLFAAMEEDARLFRETYTPGTEHLTVLESLDHSEMLALVRSLTNREAAISLGVWLRQNMLIENATGGNRAAPTYERLSQWFAEAERSLGVKVWSTRKQTIERAIQERQKKRG